MKLQDQQPPGAVQRPAGFCVHSKIRKGCDFHKARVFSSQLTFLFLFMQDFRLSVSFFHKEKLEIGIIVYKRDPAV